MAIYRSEELRKMEPEKRQEKLAELTRELLRERGIQAAGGAPDNPGRIRELRRTIARIQTLEHQPEGGGP
ncbi:MAG: 50S ribosomal protein L29 [Euryarchaeota archaeon]|nr:50S ribosomal protein L29 [Euryarchaeota archaeon]